MIVDGVSNLDEWYNASTSYEYLTDSDRIFAGFLEECFKHDGCPLRSIDGTTFSSAEDLKQHVNDFLVELEKEPIPVYLNSSNYGALTRQRLVANGIFFALYSPKRWPEMADILAQLLNGNATAAHLAYSESWVSDILIDSSNSFVVQNDNWKTGKEAPAHGIEAVRNLTKSVPQMSYLMSEYVGSDAYDRASWRIETTHSFRPKYWPDAPPVKTAYPLLILSTSWDPVCPLISATKTWKSFDGAGMVEQRSYGHCTMSMPSLCTAKHVRRYFNEGTIPKIGAL